MRRVVDELLKRLEEPLRQAVSGAIDRASLNRRPRHAEIDWNRTTGEPAPLSGGVPHHHPGDTPRARPPSRGTLKDVILCIDSRARWPIPWSIPSIFGAVMARCPAVSTRLVVFDTTVIDLSEQIDDPSMCCSRCSSAAAPTSTVDLLLRHAHHPARRHRVGADLGPLRGRGRGGASSRRPEPSSRRACRWWRCWPSPTRGPPPTTGRSPPGSRGSACPPSPARRPLPRPHGGGDPQAGSRRLGRRRRHRGGAGRRPVGEETRSAVLSPSRTPADSGLITSWSG